MHNKCISKLGSNINFIYETKLKIRQNSTLQTLGITVTARKNSGCACAESNILKGAIIAYATISGPKMSGNFGNASASGSVLFTYIIYVYYRCKQYAAARACSARNFQIFLARLWCYCAFFATLFPFIHKAPKNQI